MDRSERAEKYRALHERGKPFLLVNAWDVPSAMIVEDAGYRAVATTSAGVAWTLGYPDGDAIPFSLVKLMVERMLSRVSVPLSVDMEAGFAEDVETVVNNVCDIAELGAVGMNFEDSFTGNKTGVREIKDQCDRIRAIRAGLESKGLDFFINARTDLYLFGLGDPETRLARTIERGQAYAEAGADGLFAAGIGDHESIRKVVDEVPLPLNVLAIGSMATPDARKQLADAGVARISIGSRGHGVSLAHFRAVAEGLREAPHFGALFEQTIEHAEMQTLMR